MFPVCHSEPELHPYMDLLPHLTPADLKRWDDFIAPLPVCHPFTGPWILGGAVRHFLLNEAPTDIDYYFASPEQWSDTIHTLFDRGAVILRSTALHCTLAYQGYTVQCVRKHFHPSAFVHLDGFDFTLCQTGWDGEHLWVTNLAYHDLLHKRMNLVSKTFQSPLGSYLRVLKYTNQGFTFSHQFMKDLVQHASLEYKKRPIDAELEYRGSDTDMLV